MVQLMLILLVIHYIGFYAFKGKSKNDALYCGIFGNVARTASSLDISSFNMLGMYNVERGRNSCGVTYDGEIYHGLDKDKIYSDFIKLRKMEPVHPLIFGHTRSASVGNSVSAENSHPFGFGKHGDGFEFIGVHNGTLKNHKELAAKYEIETTVPITKQYVSGGTTYETTRDKIDSEILLEILWKTKSYKVLSEYIGTAALVWTWSAEPNKVYLWSGASKHNKGDSSPSLYEERPMCVYSKGKYNMFFSSIDESLYAIGGNQENAKQIAYNTIHIITNGEFAKAEQLHISRKNAGQAEATVSYAKTYGRHSAYEREWEDDWGDVWDHSYGRHIDMSGHKNKPAEYYVDLRKNKTKEDSCEVQFMNPNARVKTSFSSGVVNILKEEPVPVPDGRKFLKFSRFRYWSNDAPAIGIYVYIKGHGFKFMDREYMNAVALSSTYRGWLFVNEHFTKKAGPDDKGFIPFPSDCEVKLYYFADGVNLKSKLDYDMCRENIKNLATGIKYLNFADLSHMSNHPVMSLNLAENTLYHNILLDGKIHNGKISVLGSDKVYSIKNGNVVNISMREDNKTFSNSKTETSLVVVDQTDEEWLKSLEDEITAREKTRKKVASVTTQRSIAFQEDDEDDEEDIIDIVKEEEEEFLTMFVKETVEEDFQEILNQLKDTENSLLSCLPNNIAEDAIDGISEIRDVINKFIKKN